MFRPVEHLSRTQRDLQRLDGRRGPQSNRAVTWGEIDALLAEIAARSQASGTRFAEALGARPQGEITAEDLVGNIPVGQIVSPVIGAPTGLTITSSVNEQTGISYVYFDWDDVDGSSGYQLGISLEGGGEFIVSAPSSFFQNSVIAGQTISARVRSINALNVPGPWSGIVNHVAQGDTVAPEVPGNVTIQAAFNGFWFRWDRSNAADIARYEVYESASSSPAPIASTNPTFTSASPLFFRGAVGDEVRRHYWIRSVDYSENASAWSARVSATTLLINEDNLGDNVIVARHLTTGELITLSAQIKDAVITDAKIENLSAAKLVAGTAIANSILVNGQALGTIQQNADNPAARINSASTNILPGRITISGPATLLDWTASGDRTRIDGGRIFTNSIDADSINTIELAADSAFITNLTSTGTSFMNQLLVRTANIDDLAVKTANIDNAAVETLKIDGNAVTIPVAQTVSNSVVGNGSFQEIQFFNHTLDEAGTILIIFSGSQGYSSGNTEHLIQLRVGGSTVTERGGFFAEDYPTLAYSASYPAGTRRISVWWKANSTVTFNNRTLIVLGVKR
jgi:hypothetical protein